MTKEKSRAAGLPNHKAAGLPNFELSRRNIDIYERHFHYMLFHGNGRHSAKELERLITRLKSGHEMLSGMQQGVPTDSPEYKEGEEHIKNVCRDILASFGFDDKGIKWEILPYPNRNPKQSNIH